MTRAREQADALGAALSALGAAVIELPTIEIHPPPDSAPLDRAIAELDAYDWLIFTSANGVRFFVDRLDDLRKLRAKICAIGPATRAAVEALHLKVDLMGKEYVAEGLLEAFAAHDLEGKRVLLAAGGGGARPGAGGTWRSAARAWTWWRPTAQWRRLASPGGCAKSSRGGRIASRSPARPPCGISWSPRAQPRCEGVRVASIGPITSATARELGVAVAVEARPFTVEGLVEAVLGLYTEMTPPSTE